MIQMTSVLDVADNSGAKKVFCIKVLGGSRRRYAGDRRHHRRVDPRSDSGRQGEEGRGRSRGHRPHQAASSRAPTAASSSSTATRAVLINKENEPIGTRIFGPVARELRAKKFMKIISLAPEVL